MMINSLWVMFERNLFAEYCKQQSWGQEPAKMPVDKEVKHAQSLVANANNRSHVCWFPDITLGQRFSWAAPPG